MIKEREMRKRITRGGLVPAVAAAVAALMLFVGCDTSDKKELVLDISSAAESILSGIEFDDSLELLEGDGAVYRYGIDDTVEVVAYAGGGYTAEEVAVFDAGTDSAAEELESKLEKYVDSQITSYRSYVPAEVARLENAVVTSEGKYVILCVSADKDKAEDVIDTVLGD